MGTVFCGLLAREGTGIPPAAAAAVADNPLQSHHSDAMDDASSSPFPTPQWKTAV